MSQILHPALLSATLGLVLSLGSPSVGAQEPVIVNSVNGQAVQMDQQALQVATPAGQQPGQKAEKNKGDKNGEKKDETKKGETKEGASVTRPKLSDVEKSGPVADQVELTSENQVVFNLKQQPWQSVLQWIADTSQLSLDWQELPGDTLNLTTTRAYSLEEARDILNRHLLTRGYTMVLNGELLSVMKLSDLKPSLVPRVEPENLDKMLDHTLCKVSFDLSWLIADEAVSELTPLLSSAGKISKMSRTNRLEVMDTAGSLKDIYAILQNEQSDSGQEQLVRTFRLQHRRAEEVIVLLRELLGVEGPPGSGGGGGGGFSMGGMQQMTSMMRQMQQQMQQAVQRMQSGGAKGGGGGMKERETRLVLNPRENMLLVQAMPDQMAIIEKAIQQIDVPVDASGSLLQNLNKMKVYQLNTVDPQVLVDLLQELGDLSPGAVLKVDKEKKSIVAVASLADHLTITTLVERLDQSGRNVEVIPLRRLDADYVAGTIKALMGPEQSQQSNNNYYGGFSRYGFGQQQQSQDKEFKIEADIQNNRLLVFANDVEMNEIRELLQKLGEIPDPDAPDNGVRVFDMNPSDDPAVIMERLQQLWQGNNPLEFDIPRKTPKQPQPKGQKDDSEGDLTQLNSIEAQQFFADLLQQSNDDTGQENHRGHKLFTTSQHPQTAPGQQERVASSADAPPVKIAITEDGRLVVTSEDRMALRQAEDLLRQLMKPASNYRVFRLKYATASWLTLNLEDYFKAEEETEDGYGYDPFFGFQRRQQKKSGPNSLGKRRLPTFIYDNFTSTILVRDADRKQLQVIEDLIAIYDVPEPAESKAMRLTKIFKLKNAKAEVVAQAVKDVFRDLLSANDKALEKKGDEKSQDRGFTYFGSAGDSDDDGETPIRFKGLLSIGFDKTSDTLIVSSSSSLMETVEELVLALDEAADSAARVQVVKVNSSVDIRLIQEKLSKLLGQKAATPKANGRQGNQPGQQAQQGQQAIQNNQ